MFGLMLEPEEKQLTPFFGMPVCLLMKDGSRKIGQLTSCRAGKLTLGGEVKDAGDATVSRKESQRRSKRPRTRKPKQSVSDKPVFTPEPGYNEFDEFAVSSLGFEPMLSGRARENVPLHSVESILVL